MLHGSGLWSQWSVKTQIKWVFFFPAIFAIASKYVTPISKQRGFKVGHLQPISELEAKDHLLLAEDFPTMEP